MTSFRPRRAIAGLRGAGAGSLGARARWRSRRCSACSTPIGFGASAGGASRADTGTRCRWPRARFGTGPVRVALLLPLTGDPALAAVGMSMANAAQLAIDYIETSPALADNITVVLKDTGASAGRRGAGRAARRCSEGASLILGPLKADQVTAAGAVARRRRHSADRLFQQFGRRRAGRLPAQRAARDRSAARSMAYAKAQGKQAFAGDLPHHRFRPHPAGRVPAGGGRPRAQRARGLQFLVARPRRARRSQQLVPLLQAGQIDALFIPDRATAPSFGVLLAGGGRAAGKVQIIGSADWNGDINIAEYALSRGRGLSGRRRCRLPGAQAPNTRPSSARARTPLATIAYTATILANASSLALGTPRYDRAQLTAARRLQRPRRRVPLPARRAQRICAGDQAGDARRRAVVDGPKL